MTFENLPLLKKHAFWFGYLVSESLKEKRRFQEAAQIALDYAKVSQFYDCKQSILVPNC
jgi:hypothetical protein